MNHSSSEIFQLSARQFNFFSNWTRLCKDTVRGIKQKKNPTFFTSIRVQYIVWKLTHPFADADTCRC